MTGLAHWNEGGRAMFALGHMQTFDDAEVMSALAPIHDHHWALVHFNLTEPPSDYSTAGPIEKCESEGRLP
jgi:hypothetical protein